MHLLTFPNFSATEHGEEVRPCCALRPFTASLHDRLREKTKSDRDSSGERCEESFKPGSSKANSVVLPYKEDQKTTEPDAVEIELLSEPHEPQEAIEPVNANVAAGQINSAGEAAMRSMLPYLDALK